MKSASVGSVSSVKKAGYLLKLFKMRVEGLKNSRSEIGPWGDLFQYEKLWNTHSSGNLSFEKCRVLEIGFGQRPWRLISLLARGMDAWGIDLEQPMFGFSPKGVVESWRANGIERALKSAIRSAFFDGADLRKLERECRDRGYSSAVDRSRFLVGNATESNEELTGKFNFIYSEDVFEHIPPNEIKIILTGLKDLLEDTGLFLIQPHIFTGIAGGHVPDFYPHYVAAQKSPRVVAWSHLYDPEFSINTYLNRLRLADYRKLFSQEFVILEEIPRSYGLGKDYLSSEIRAKIPPDISDEELLTNEVMFVLGKRDN